jgi:hypothetical protein
MEKKIITAKVLRALIAETEKENRDLEKILESYKKSKYAFMKAYESGASNEELCKMVISAKEDAEKFGEKFSSVRMNCSRRIKAIEDSDLGGPEPIELIDAEKLILLTNLAMLIRKITLLGDKCISYNSEMKKALGSF